MPTLKIQYDTDLEPVEIAELKTFDIILDKMTVSITVSDDGSLDITTSASRKWGNNAVIIPLSGNKFNLSVIGAMRDD